LVGGARLAGPPREDENEPPEWLGFAPMIRTRAPGDEEPGPRSLSAPLEEDGFDDLGAGRVGEICARRRMSEHQACHGQGCGEIAKRYVAGLVRESVVRRDIAENGELLVRRAMGSGEVEQRSLLRALGEPSWFEPVTGGPRK